MPTSNPLHALVPIVDEWRKMQRHYCEAVEADAAFWCTEQTNTALLAAAAWRVGGVGIVQYQDKRETESGCANGIVDLWLQVGQQGSPSYVVESKQIHHLTPSSDVAATAAWIRAYMEAAEADVKTCRPAGTNGRVAVVYAVPKLTDIDQLAELQAAVDTVEADIKVYVDVSDRELRWPPASSRHIFPGVFLLARLVRP